MDNTVQQRQLTVSQYVFVFGLTVLVTASIIAGLAYIVSLAATLPLSIGWLMALLGASVLLSVAVMVKPMAKRWKHYRQGVDAFAENLGAVRVKSKTGYDSDDRLIETVVDLAKSLAVETPSVWLLRADSGINAFSLCSDRTSVDTNDSLVSIIVTQGAVDRLTGDELKGLIAHQYGLRLTSDLAQQTRLSIVLSGLLSLEGCAQRLLIRRSLSARGFVSFCGGWACRVLGVPGLIGARFIRAVITPGRILQADSSAVDFSRNIDAVLSLMQKTMQSGNRSFTAFTGVEFDHLGFHTSHSRFLYTLVGHTHPSLSERLLAIDPSYQARKEEIESSGESSDAGVILEPTDTKENIGRSGLSDRFELYVADPLSSLAAVFALFVPDNAQSASKYYDGIAFAYQRPFARRVAEIRQALGTELDINVHAVIDFVGPMLVDVKEENKRLTLLNLEKLITASNDMGARNYLLLQYIRHRLGCDFVTLDTIAVRQVKAEGTKLKGFSHMSSEIGLLVSLLVEASGGNVDGQDRVYRQLLKNFTDQYIPRRSQRDLNIVKELDVAYHTLAAQSLVDRQRLYEQCSATLQFEKTAKTRDRPLLQIFAASIGLANVSGPSVYYSETMAA